MTPFLSALVILAAAPAPAKPAVTPAATPAATAHAVGSSAATVVASPAVATLRFVPPPAGFRRDRASVLFLLALDAHDALVDAPAPALTGAPPPEKVAAGIWRVTVTPGAGRVSLSATLNEVHGSLEAPVRDTADAVLEVALSRTTLSPRARPPVTATIHVKNAAGAPLDLTPTVDVNAGGVGKPTRSAPGTYEARLRLPEEHYPQAVQVVAFLPGKDAVPARAILTMEGQASIPIVTKPKSKVTIRVGRRRYGPLAADVHGALEAEIEASPSDTSMDVESVDEVGNRSSKAMAIDAPPYSRLWANLEADPPALDGKTRVRITALALDRRGRADDDAKATAIIDATTIPLASDGGVLAGEERLAVSAGRHDVVVRAGDQRKTLHLDVAAPPPVAVRLNVSPERIVVGGDGAAVTAQLVDASGATLPDGKIDLSGDGVAMAGVQANAGRATGTAKLAGGLVPKGAAIVATAPGPGFTIMSRDVVDVQAGAPAKAEILVEPKPTFADGSSVTSLAVRFSDAWGNPVEKLAPKVSASAGGLGGAKSLGDGTYSVTLRAPRIPGPSRIAMDAGAAHAEAMVEFLRAPSRWSAGLSAGAMHNLGALAQEYVAVEARRDLYAGAWWADLRVLGSTGSFRIKVTDTAGITSSYDTAVRQTVAHLGARRIFGSPLASWTPSVAAFVALGSIDVTVKGPAAPPARSGMVTGARVAAALERRVGGGAFTLETGFGWSQAESKIIESNVSGAELSVGYRHGF